ncbi:MAG: DNA/RNA nuclease SfsA [Alphaproteobacteria bacterium]
MFYPVPLIEGRLVRRYKRFLADVELRHLELADGGIETVHCPNPGAMMGLLAPAAPVWLLPAANPKAKLRLAWELVEADGVLVGINANRPNRLVEEALAVGLLPVLAGYSEVRREVRYGLRSRVDLVLTAADRPPCYVEIKNVHLRRGGWAEFPDCVSARGARHLGELGTMAEHGCRAMVLFVVQRADCDRLRLATDLDPAFAAAMARALSRGVEVAACVCTITTAGVTITREIPFHTEDLPDPGGMARG